MIKTPNLDLPIYDKPSTDTFKVADWNKANENIDYVFGELKNNPNVNAIDVKAREDIINNHRSVTEQMEDKANKDNVMTKNNMLNFDSVFVQGWDGAGDALHPSVLYFPNKWNGYKFWMAHTPLTLAGDYIDRWECPCIVVSNNGVEWQEIGTNPLDQLTTDQVANKDYFSDPTLCYNSSTNEIEIVYRYTNRTTINKPLYIRRRTTNGTTWTDREIIIDYDTTTSFTDKAVEIVSPQLFFNNGKYRMYYTSINGMPRFIEATNLTNNSWSVKTQCNFDNTTIASRMWHIGMCLNNGKFEMLGYSYDGNVYYFSSDDGVNFKYKGIAIPKPHGGADIVYSLYQTFPVFVDDCWYVYATVKKNEQFPRTRNTLMLFTGEDLLNLIAYGGNYKPSSMIYNGDVILNSNDKTNGLEWNFISWCSGDKQEQYGYGTHRTKKYPLYKNGDNANKVPIMTCKIVSTLPIPQYIGQVVLNTTNYMYYISTGTSLATEWLCIKPMNEDGSIPSLQNKGVVVNTKLSGMGCANTIDVTNLYNITIVNTTTTNYIDNLTGGVDKQEIIIFNIAGDVTIKHNSVIKIRAQADRVLKQFTSIRLFKYGSMWIEM